MRATILVEPIAKGRPKATMVGNHIRVYSPAKTIKAESDIMASIRSEVAKMERFVAGEPLVLWVTFYRERPKFAAKRVKHPVTRPDLDNYLKILLDALDRYAFPDDAQIVNIHAKKAFAEPGTTPRIDFVLEREND